MNANAAAEGEAGASRARALDPESVDAGLVPALAMLCRAARGACHQAGAAVGWLEGDQVLEAGWPTAPGGDDATSHTGYPPGPWAGLVHSVLSGFRGLRGVVRVADPGADPRLSAWSAVSGGSASRGGFAAVGLVGSDGGWLGLLAVWGGDSWMPEDAEMLEAMGEAVLTRIELGRSRRHLQDLAEQHARVDAALREAEGKFRDIFENTVVGIYQTTPEGRYLSANPMLARIYGYSGPEELMSAVGDIGQELYVDPQDRQRFVEAMQREDTLSDFESRIRRKDGQVIWIAENARVVRDEAGRVRLYEGTVQDITARRLAEERLRNSEVLYHSLVEELPQHVFRKDLEERFIFANTRFCQNVGRTWAEVEGRTDFDLFPPELARKYQEDDQRVIADGRTVRVTEANITPDGEVHWVEVIKTPLRDHKGDIAGIQGIFWDVTATKRLQDALAYERDLLQALLDHSPDIIYFQDPQSRFVKVGRAVARRFDVSDPEQLVGKTVFDLVEPGLAQVFYDEEQEILRTGNPIVNKVEKLVDQKGGRSWTSVTKVPIYDRAGKILGLVGVARDITQLIETEQALRDAEEKYRAIFENSVEGIFQTTLDGRFLQANPALARIYGFPSTDELMAARTDVRTQVYVEPGRREEFVRQVLEHGSITGFESEIFRRDGTRTWVSESARAVRSGDGTTAYFEGTIEEITTRKQVEAEREKARQAALESARMKSEFVATVSHEIRTPLNAIVPSAEQLARTRLDRHQRHLVDSVEHGAQMLLQIVNDILEVSRIDSGTIALEEIPFDLHEVVERAVAFFATPAHAKRLELVGHLRPGVPRHVCGDPARLGQVLNNLLGNAIKFTHRGEVVVEVEPGAMSEDRVGVAFRVRDTGIGIPPEARARVFTAFAQADGSMARRYGGTGLGLTISRRFVELMGGDIDFESEVGRGTTFRFQVFLKPAAPVAPESPIPTILDGLRVLVVEDSAAHREVLVAGLATLGPISVAGVGSLSEAVEHLRSAALSRHAVDLVFFDGELPGSDLVQAARRLRAATTPGCRLVALTAPGAMVDARGLEAAGLCGTLVKPVRQSRLETEIGALLGAPPQDDALAAPGLDPAAPPFAPLAEVSILLVEDNPLNQRVARGMLERLGATVDAVAGGPQALEAVSRRAYDLILMDCQMPEMDGYETTRRIREAEASRGDGRHIPIVALSANALAGDRDRGLEAGMDDYLTKPLRQPELVRVLSSVVSGRPSEPSVEAAPGTPGATGNLGPEAGMGGVAVPVSEVEEVPVFDPTPLSALGPAGDPTVAEFVDQFGFESGVRLERVEAALAAGDAPRVALEVHSLKGNASYMGVRRVVQTCAELETSARAGDLSQAGESLRRIRAELESAKAALQGYLQPPTGGR